MNTIFIGKNLIEVEKVDSTNSYMVRLHEENPLFEGTLVIAKHQGQGRGQRGTTWESEPGKNLTLSLFLQPGFLPTHEQFLLNKMISLGVMELISSVCTSDVKIKWPNDIYVGDKKIAGILIENSVFGNKIQYTIVGIGINVNQEKFSPDLLNPTSLKLIAGVRFDLARCLSQLCFYIEKRYIQLKSNRITEIDKDYLNALYQLGEWKNYSYQNETVIAKISGLTKNGKLILQKQDGEALICDLKEVKFI